MSATRAAYGTSEGYPALPPGPNQLGPEYVDRYQRRRLVVAVAELAHEEGLAGVTVSALAERARVSRKTFYDYFDNRDQCVDYASAEAAAHLFEPVAEVTARRGDGKRVPAGVRALLDAVRSEPKLAELAFIHGPALGGERGRHFQEVAIEAISALPAAAAGAKAPARGSETIASAIIGVIACGLRRGEAEQLDEVAGELVRLAGLGAVGAESVESKRQT